MKKTLLGSLVFVVIYNVFFFPTLPGAGIPILFGLFHLYLFLVRGKDSKNVNFGVLLSVLSVLFAAGSAYRANMEVQAIDFLVTLFLTFAAAFMYKKISSFSLDLPSFILSPLTVFGRGLVSINNFFSQNKTKISTEKHTDLYNAIFRGVVITVPILFILFILLTGADPIFKTLASKISFSISDQAIFTVIVFVMCFFWGLATIKDKILPHREEKKDSEKLAIEAIIATGGAAILFGIFLLIQLRYLFLHVPETELHNLGINVATYSEYVRQGFFNLLIASAISTSIIAYVLQRLQTNIKNGVYLRISTAALALETQLLLVSAGKRLYLYEQFHGFTRSRIYGIVFLLWLSLLLIVLLIAVIKKAKHGYLFITTFIITLVALASFNIIPIDRLIAEKFPPTINHEIDNVYISLLSEEAASSWPGIVREAQIRVEQFDNTQKPSAEDYRRVYDARMVLFDIGKKVYYLDRKYTPSEKQYIKMDPNNLWHINPVQKRWQAFNKSEYDAYLVVENNRELFAKIGGLLKRIDDKITALSTTPTPTPSPIQQ